MKRRIPFYEVYQGADKLWRWRQIAANGQKTAAQGEPSASKRGAVEAVTTHARIAHEILYGCRSGDKYIAGQLAQYGRVRICTPWYGSSPLRKRKRWINYP